MSKSYKIHPVAALFPMLPDEELATLADDIEKNGLRDPIVTCREPGTKFQMWIIDGRNRLKACEMRGVEPKFREEKTDNISAYIVSTNVHRRHLTTQQRSAIAAEMATLKEGRPKKNEDKTVQNCTVSEGLTLEQAADLMNVSRRGVASAKKRMNENPEAHEKAKAGIKEPRKNKKKPAGPKYSAITIAHEEGLLVSPKGGGSWHPIRDAIKENYPDIDLSNPKHEPQLRAAYKALLAERDPDAAERKVAEIQETLTPTQRENFDKKFDNAVSLRAHQHIRANVEAALAEERAELDAERSQLNEWEQALTEREADITAYMTEQEFNHVRGCLHPDRAGDDDMLRKRLDKAFNIFNRLKTYIRKYPKPVLKERGWA